MVPFTRVRSRHLFKGAKGTIFALSEGIKLTNLHWPIWGMKCSYIHRSRSTCVHVADKCQAQPLELMIGYDRLQGVQKRAPMAVFSPFSYSESVGV